MQEVFEKIIEKLKETSIFMTTRDGYGANCVSVGTIEEIVKQEAAEYNNGWIQYSKEKPKGKGEYSVSYPDGTVSIQYWDGKFFTEVDTVSGKSIVGQPVAWKQKDEPYRPCTNTDRAYNSGKDCPESEGCGGYKQKVEPKIQTNADRIKSMPIEELAELFYSLINLEDEIKFCKNKTECEDILDAGKTIPDKMCKKCLVDWMQSEEEEPDER